MECNKCEREAIECYSCWNRKRLFSEERFGTLEANERRWYAQLSTTALFSLIASASLAIDARRAQAGKLELIRRGTLTLEDANKTWPEIKAEWLWT